MKFIEDAKEIHFDEDKHVYTYQNQELISVTTFISRFANKFDEDGSMLANKAQKLGISKSQLQKQWDAKRDRAAKDGTFWHETIEHYLNTGKVRKNKFSHLVEEFKNFTFRGKVFSEVLLSLPDIGLAGTSDIVQIIDDKIVQVHDFKVTEKRPSDFSYGKYMKEPISHLPDSKITKFSLQISLYMYILSVRYGYEIGDNNSIFWINRKKSAIERIPIELKLNEVIDMIAYYSYEKMLANTNEAR